MQLVVVRRVRLLVLLGTIAVTLFASLSPGFSQTLPKITADRTKILDKLRTHSFDQLESELSSYLQQAMDDPRFEMNAMVAFAAFETPRPDILEKLGDWVQLSPHSYAAHLARASGLSGAGWRWRGTGSIEDISEYNKNKMDEYLRDARQEADAALAIDRKLGLAYALLIKAARGNGSSEESTRVRNEALGAAPASFAVREQIMYQLRPIWGGSQEAMQSFADSSQSYASQNPAMQFLKGWVAWDTGDGLANQGRWEEAVKYYTNALEQGGEFWTVYRRRARAFYALQRWNEAIQDGMRANELFPQYSETIKLLAFATAKVHKPEASIMWTALYLKVDMPEPSLFELTKLNQKELKQQGKENW